MIKQLVSVYIVEYNKRKADGVLKDIHNIRCPFIQAIERVLVWDLMNSIISCLSQKDSR